MYSRTKHRTMKKKNQRTSLLSVLLLTVISFFAVKFFGSGLTSNVAVADTQKTEPSIKRTATDESVTVTNLSAQPVATQPSSESTPAPTEEPQVEEVVEVVSTQEVATGSGYSMTLANGNTAGVIGTEAAARMAAATGVPQETWEYIIARESNGDPTVANASGASGLFQTIPGWGSTATVEDQINTAIHVYNNQGLAAWGMQ